MDPGSRNEPAQYRAARGQVSDCIPYRTPETMTRGGTCAVKIIIKNCIQYVVFHSLFNPRQQNKILFYQEETKMNEIQTNQNQVQETVTESVQVPAPVEIDYNVRETDQYAITSRNVAPVYCTIDDSTQAGKKKLFKIKNRPDHNISDFINKQIKIKDIYIDVNARVQKDGENAGVVENKPRTILIDDKGESYIAGVSIGIYQAVKEIIRTFGSPDTWDEPLTVTVVQVKTARGNMLSLDIV